MARINIYDSIYQDRRFFRFAAEIGSMELAMGCLVFAWRAVQTWAEKSPSGLIPIAEWSKLLHHDKILNNGLAELKESGIYVKGSQPEIDRIKAFLEKQRRNGKKGGTAKSLNNFLAKPSQTWPNLAKPSPLPLPLPLKEELIHTSTASTRALPRLAEIWNANRGKLPEVKGCSTERVKKANARWNEVPDPDYWTSVVRKIAASSFCNGDSGHGWRATFDFLIKPDTHHKVLEGSYGQNETRLEI